MKNINLSEWALKHQSLVMYLMITCMLAGVLTYTKLGRKEDPEFTFKAMMVRAYWPGASASDVEKQVTDRLEKKLQEVGYVDYIKSYSKAGEAQLLLNLREGVQPKDVPDAWYQVRKKVSDIRHTLPADVVGPFFNDEFGDTFGNVYAFTSDGFTYAEVKDYVDRAKTELLRLSDVNKVELIGEQEEKIYLDYSTSKLASLGIDPALIAQTISTQNSMDPAGVVSTDTERVQVRVTGDFQSIEAIKNIGIRANNRTFRLGDIVKVYRGYTDPATFKMRFNGKEAIGLSVSMRKGGDVIMLGESIANTMKQVEASLPVGIEIHAVSDQPRVVKASISEFMKSLLEAVVIVLAVSLWSLGMRTGIVVALSIPLVLAMTFLAMWFLNIDLQRISLGALIIALGLLVDDAIIAVEMMALKLEQGWDRFRAATFAYTSTAFPMLTGTLITAAGFLPVGLAKSNAGEYTISIFQVVGLALIISWIVAVVFTPFIGFKLLPEMKGHSHNEDEVYHKPFYVKFRKLVTWCLEHRKLVIGLTLAAFLGSVVLFKFVPKQFFPASSRPELMVDLWLPQAASYEATEREVKRFEDKIKAHPGVVSYTSYVGSGSPRFFLSLDQQQPNLNYGQLMVMTKDEKIREDVIAFIQKQFEMDFALVRGRVTRLENGPPVGYPVQFRVSGPDAEVLKPIAEKVANMLRAHPNARHVNNDWGERIKVMRLDVDQDKARALGISSQQLSRTLQTAISGATITQYREGDKRLDVVARLTERERTDLNRLKDVKVHIRDGKFVPLAQIAHIRLESEESIIWRRNRIPTITVRADVHGAQPNDISMALMPKFQEMEKSLPPGYHIELAGSAEASAKSQGSINAVMPLMLAVVLTLLMLQLQNFQKTLLVFLTAPLGLIGVSLILATFQVPFGFVAMLGVIALSGMIMRNSVILVDQIDQDIARGMAGWDAVVESAVRRFRPIMLTALAAILGMIPLTRSTFWGPMAWAIMGGLFVATLLTLLFLPALYAQWFGIRREKDLV